MVSPLSTPFKEDNPDSPGSGISPRNDGSESTAAGAKADHPKNGEDSRPSRRHRVMAHNLTHRLVTGVPAFAALLALVAYAPPVWIAGVVAVAGVWGLVEYLHMFTHGPMGFAGARPVVPLAFVAALTGLGGLTGSPLLLQLALLVAVLGNVSCCLFREEAGRGLPNTGIALAGLVLVPYMLNHLGLIAWLPQGRPLLLFLILALALGDTLAYTVGTKWGRRPLMPTVSPNKTVEGALGGLAGGAIAGAVAAWFWPEPLSGDPRGFWDLGGWGAMVLLGVAMAWAGMAGDLLESKLKRINGVKDSGLFLPGHGGILDRLDAYLLAGPVLYYLARAWMWLDGPA